MSLIAGRSSAVASRMRTLIAVRSPSMKRPRPVQHSTESPVAMDRLRREGGNADGDVLGAPRFRCTVTHPFAARRRHRLTSLYPLDARPGFNVKDASKHDGVFVELRRLARLRPSRRTVHPRDAQGFSA